MEDALISVRVGLLDCHFYQIIMELLVFDGTDIKNTSQSTLLLRSGPFLILIKRRNGNPSILFLILYLFIYLFIYFKFFTHA